MVCSGANTVEILSGGGSRPSSQDARLHQPLTSALSASHYSSYGSPPERKDLLNRLTPPREDMPNTEVRVSSVSHPANRNTAKSPKMAKSCQIQIPIFTSAQRSMTKGPLAKSRSSFPLPQFAPFTRRVDCIFTAPRAKWTCPEMTSIHRTLLDVSNDGMTLPTHAGYLEGPAIKTKRNTHIYIYI